MTLHINPIVFYCWLAVAIYEIIAIYLGFLKVKKKLATDETVQMFIAAFKQSPGMQLYKGILNNPISYTCIIVIISIVSPLLFIGTIIRWVKKLVGYKSPLEKKAEEEAHKIEEAKKAAEDFMRNEGRGIPEFPPIDEPNFIVPPPTNIPN